MKIQVYDPALCCSSGVCGPDPDAALIQFSADLEWVRSTGTEAIRFNLGQEPGAFAGNPTVRRALTGHGVASLPMVLVDGEVFTQGRYPTREELAARLVLPRPAPAPAGGSA